MAVIGVLGGNLVTEARRRAGLTQRELAERAGATQSAIARLESGRSRATFERIQELLRHCGFSLLVQLDPYDDSDIAQAEAMLRTSVDNRIANLEAALEFGHELRKAFKAKRSA